RRSARGRARRANRRVQHRRRRPRRPAHGARGGRLRRRPAGELTVRTGRRRRRKDARSRGLDAVLGFKFRDPELIDRALAHRSYCAEHPDTLSNERLEFLGDAVLGLIVTDYMVAEYPDMPEGELAKLRASVVNSEVLAEVARDALLGVLVFLGTGEVGTGGRETRPMLADCIVAR